MSDFNGHPSFRQPENPDTPLWRYMDTAKLGALLMAGELPLIRLDQMPDQFEGVYPVKARERFIEWIRGGATRELSDADIEPHLKNFDQWSPAARRTMYVSCWHLSDHESEAMWRIYCETNNGLAVVLKYRDMVDIVLASNHTKSATHTENLIGEVRYVDFRTETFLPGNMFDLAMHKRREFSYEREVRIAKLFIQPQDATAVPIPFPLLNIQRIVISPYARGWYAKTVRDLAERLVPGLGSKVVQSAMK